MSKPPPSLHKHKSLSTDFYREETWLRRKGNHRRSKSLVTTQDIEELKGCVDLGFHFTDQPTALSKTFPALDLYYATSTSSTSSSPWQSQPSSPATNAVLFNSGESPEIVKRTLKQWAQVVACASRQPACQKLEPKETIEPN